MAKHSTVCFAAAHPCLLLYVDLLSKQVWILKTLLLPGKSPSLHPRSTSSAEGLQERGEPLEERLSSHVYSNDYWVLVLSCFITQDTFKHGISCEVKRKVTLCAEQSQGRDCKQHRSETTKVDHPFLIPTCLFFLPFLIFLLRINFGN